MISNSPFNIAPLLLRNLLTSIFFHADKSLIHFSQKYTLLQSLRCFLTSSFIFTLRILPSLFPDSTPEPPNHHPVRSPKHETYYGGVTGDSGVARALSQLLLIMNDIPVSSRKYEVVRSLAEKFIDENLSEGNKALNEVNCTVLSAAFAMSLSQLELAVAEQGRRIVGDSDVEKEYYFCTRARRVAKKVKRCGSAVWRYAKSRDEMSRSGSSAEKLAAELLWLAQKMAPSGCADEAVCKWASAERLASLALAAEPRLQGSLVKVSAYLIKQAKEMGTKEEEGTNTLSDQQHIRQTKMKLLISWLPLLCRANNGTDAPILNMAERAELERILEEIISALDEEQVQEQVLSLWLHNFAYCAASDWPDLRTCYTQWFTASRKSLQLSPLVALN